MLQPYLFPAMDAFQVFRPALVPAPKPSGYSTTRLLSQQDMNEPGGVPPWLVAEYATFRRKVLDPKYPCYFGTIAEKKGDLFYTYLKDDPVYLPATLSAFLKKSRDNPTARLGLVLFVQPEVSEQPHEYYGRRFWDLLQLLHDQDPSPWPAGYPHDPADPKWEFCFDGDPMFLFTGVPTHQVRSSRNLGNGLVVLFQPRRIFNGIEGGSPAGIRARQLIRQRLVAWEGLEPHPDLGDYGDPSIHEWKQYFLSDDNSPGTGQCPFNHGKVRP